MLALLVLLTGAWASGPLRRYWLTTLPLPELESYTESHPAESEAAVLLARRCLADKNPAKAEEVLTRLLQRNGQDPRGWLLLSQAQMDAGKPAEAYASLQVALPFLSDSAEAHWRLAVLLERRGDEDAAEKEFQRAFELDRGHVGARMELARSALAHRHYAPALEHLRAITRKEPRSAAALELLSLTYRNLGDLPQAERSARAAVRVAPDNARCWKALAQALQDEATDASVAEAERAYRRLLELDPDSSDAHHQLGMIYFRRRDYPGAAGELRRSVEIQPLNRMPYPTLIQVYLRLGQSDLARKAREDYEKVNEMDLSTAPLEYAIYATPENTRLRTRLAGLYLKYRRPDLAQAQVDQVLKLNPSDRDALRLREQIKRK